MIVLKCTINKGLISTMQFLRVSFLLCAIIISSISSWSQNETNNWYFGERAGLLFDLQNDPDILFNGKMIAENACATISDKDGNLLFYTNGTNVWDSNHNIMINGVLVEPLGMVDPVNLEPNILLNVMIIPIKDSENLHYIFTITSADGLRYSLVDMDRNNGLGEVVFKNRVLLPGEGVGKLTAVHHADGKSIWLLTTKKNESSEYSWFYAYKIETNGNIGNGIITNDTFYKGLQEGQMKFSPDGKKIACANYRPQSLSDHLMTFDFNSENGIVSNRRNVLTSFVFFEVVSAFGVEFSNDSKYLYASLVRQGMFRENSNEFIPDEIRKNLLYQYDMSNSNPQTNWTSIDEAQNELTAASLQLAKNGKIYRALTIDKSQGTPLLGVINNPHELGEKINYTNKAIDLGSNRSRLGLPNFIQSYFRTRVLADNACIGIPIPMEVDTYADITEVIWDFGDGNTSNEIEAEHAYTASGNYQVTAIITINNCPITVTKDIEVYNLPNLEVNQQLVQCDLDTDGISIFNLNTIRDKITNPLYNEELVFYETRLDAELDMNQILNPENYTNIEPNQEIFIRVINDNGCFEISSFLISAVFVDLGKITEMYACDSSDLDSNDGFGIFSIGFKRAEIREEVDLEASTILEYYPTLIDALTKQNEIDDRFFSSPSTTIWVRAQEENFACSGIAPINLIVNSAPKIDIEEEYLICKNQPIELFGDKTNDRFEWVDSNGSILSTQREFSFFKPGSYQHIAYKTENGIECSNTFDFVITKTEPPSFNNIEIKKIAKNRHLIYIQIDGSGKYEFSIDNINYFKESNSYNFENVPAGKHTIYVRDINQCEPTIQENVYILGYPSFFTPNNDGMNDFWTVLGLSEDELLSTRVNIYDRFGKLITYLNEENNYRWDGKYNENLAAQNDYWFEVIFIDGTINRGHFTLKRY